MGDFNIEPNDATMKNFFQIYGCKITIKDKTCFKSPLNPTCIDLIITIIQYRKYDDFPNEGFMHELESI